MVREVELQRGFATWCKCWRYEVAWWLVGRGSCRFSLPFLGGKDGKGCKAMGCSRWYSSCVENRESKDADWSIMWSGPLSIGLRLEEEEEDAANCMLRNQKVGGTWRLAVRLGHVTTPAKLIGAPWSAVTWCWKKTSWLTQMVRSVVVTLQRGSVLLIDGNWTQKENKIYTCRK